MEAKILSRFSSSTAWNTSSLAWFEWPPLWEALSRRRAEGEPAPTYINCRHEGLAVGIAAGYHRATRKLPAVILHTTSGGLNCVPNLEVRCTTATPMLVVAGESISYGDGDAPDPGAQWLADCRKSAGRPVCWPL